MPFVVQLLCRRIAIPPLTIVTDAHGAGRVLVQVFAMGGAGQSAISPQSLPNFSAIVVSSPCPAKIWSVRREIGIVPIRLMGIIRVRVVSHAARLDYTARNPQTGQPVRYGKRIPILMTQTWIQDAFSPFKKWLPRWLSNLIRSTCTAFLTPILFSWRTGHFKSSFKMMAVSKSGQPLPWYTYPSIDFLKGRSYTDKTVLEFGAGQSTLWWAQRTKSVFAFEADAGWLKELTARVPSNVQLHKVPGENPAACVNEIQRTLSQLPNPKFDIVIIDGGLLLIF